jgi:tellurite methyltransferase
MEKIEDKWNRIHQARHAADAAIATVLSENAELLPEGASIKCLDIACGLGTNSIFLAKRGFSVDAWDISTVAIKKLGHAFSGLDIHPLVVDISRQSLIDKKYHVIVNINYLDRSLVPGIIQSLLPGGLIFFETFTSSKVISKGPSNPDYLLGEDELLFLFQNLKVLAYRDESTNQDPGHPLAGRAYLVAQKAAG